MQIHSTPVKDGMEDDAVMISFHGLGTVGALVPCVGKAIAWYILSDFRDKTNHILMRPFAFIAVLLIWLAVGSVTTVIFLVRCCRGMIVHAISTPDAMNITFHAYRNYFHGKTR